MMSEAELHVLKERMYQGKLNKARRGELFGHAPDRLRPARRRASGRIDPDEQVQAVVRLIFDQFDREATLHGLLRYLVHHGIRIPVRPQPAARTGASWSGGGRTGRRLQNLLHHPSYAGAYRFGHRPVDPRRKQPGRPTTGKLIRRPGGVPGADPRPAAGVHHLGPVRGQPGAADGQPQLPDDRPARRGTGPSLLAGLVRCGRCGRRMVVRYSGPRSRPCVRLHARVGRLRRAALPEPVRGRRWTSWSPARSWRRSSRRRWRRAWRRWPRSSGERAELTRQWQLRRERARYEAERAARQYQACEPENRLVARELERRWEEALKQQRQLEDEYDRFGSGRPRPS